RARAAPSRPGERALDERPGRPLERVERALPRQARDVLHHDDRVDAEEERERRRQAFVGDGVEVVTEGRQRLLDPAETVPGATDARTRVEREAEDHAQRLLVIVGPLGDAADEPADGLGWGQAVRGLVERRERA